MNKVKILCGCSGSGKDYIAKTLTTNCNYQNLISVTTRPVRENEKDGVDYFFETKSFFEKMIINKKLIEYRKYETLLNGKRDIWYYGLPKYTLNLRTNNYVVILDLNGVKSFIDYYGKENCEIYFIQCSEEERKRRAKLRGGYDEIEFNRRLSADKKDFSKEKIYSICDKIIVNENKNIKDVIKEIIGVN